MTYLYSDVEKQLCSIATANWDDQYLTADGIVKDRSVIGRLFKILGLTKIDWVKNVLFNASLPNSALKVKALLVASRNEASLLPEKVRNDLHLKVEKRFNELIGRYNARNTVKEACIDLSMFFAKIDAVGRADTPATPIFQIDPTVLDEPLRNVGIEIDSNRGVEKLQWPDWLHGPIIDQKEYPRVFQELIDAAKNNKLSDTIGGDEMKLHAVVCLSNIGPNHNLAKSVATTKKAKEEALGMMQKSVKELTLFQQCLLLDIAESKRVTTNATTRKMLRDNLVESYKSRSEENSEECTQLKEYLEANAKEAKNAQAQGFFAQLLESIK
ncbi:MAG: hypothetical protein JSR46_10575 [Verrucomicrobia bacterium]|nr:hypothetical protein [Verrucomicrobiota bacterium]